MAANINLHQPRMEHALTEHDDNNGEPTIPDGQTPSQSNTNTAALTDQQGNSAGDGSGSNNDAGANESYTPGPPSPEESIPLPVQFRYGLGDTVIMGRPDYTRAYADRAEPSAGKPSSRETAFAPAPRAENTPAPANAAAPAAKPIPMPKPGGTLSPTSASLPAPAATASPAITNAPRIGGEAVRQALAADQRNSQNVTGTAPTASDAELDAVDAMLADPINKQLIDLAKPQMGLADTKNSVAEAQIKLYGEARFQEMMYLHRALPIVQNAYAGALNSAYSSGSFEINAFNKEYASRSDLMAQAFAVKFGGMPVTVGATEFGATSGDGAALGISAPVFTVGGLFSVTMQPSFPTGYADGQEAPPPTYFASAQTLGAYGNAYVLGQDIGDHRAMFDDAAVWFDPSLGFVTDPQNLKDDEDSTWDRIMVVATQATLTGAFVMTGNVALFGPSGAFASSVAGFPAGSVGYAAIQGGVGGAIGAVANSAATGRPLTLADLGRSILTGGVMGGLVNYAGLDTYGLDNSNLGVAVNSRQVIDWGQRLTAILGRGTMQGILQEVTGGRFRDGLVNGVASGLGAEMSRQLNIRINEWAAQNNVPPFIASQLRMVGQGFSSALASSAANGGRGGVEAFLTDLINNEIGEAVEIDRAEVNQLTTQYNEALRSNDVNTQATVLNNLVDRWMNNHPEHNQQQALEQVIQGLGWTVEASRFARDGNGQLVAATSSTTTPTVDRPTAVTRLAMAYRAADNRISEGEATQLANEWIDRNGIPATFAPLRIEDVVVTESRNGGAAFIDNLFGAGATGLLSASIASLQATGQTLTVDALMDAATRLFGSAAEAAGPWVLRALGVLGAVFMPRNIGSDRMQVDLPDGTRFIVGNGAIRGQLQARDQNGDWQTINYNAVLVNTPTGRVAMTEEELLRYRGPLINVPSVPDPNGGVHVIPPLTDEERNRLNGTTISPIGPGSLPPLEGFRLTPRTPQDFITTMSLEADPARNVYGPGTVSHPEEIARMRQELANAGVQILDQPGTIGYGPGTSPGKPGQISMDPNASYSAWLHEFQHAMDDQAIGWGGFRTLYDTDLRIQWELRAYDREISFARQHGQLDLVRQLENNRERERQRILEEHKK
jgi:hypothetical protein